MKFQFDGALNRWMQVTLPHGRSTTGSAGGIGDPGVHVETCWRYVSATGILEPGYASNSAVKTKGYRSLKVRLESNVVTPDRLSAKLATPSGGLWLLALRAG